MSPTKLAQKKRPSRRTFWAAVMALGGAGLLAADAGAVSIDWDNESGDGNYNNPLNWSTNAVPTGGDDAAFVNALAGAANITADTPALRDFRFGDDGRTGGGVVNHSAGTVTLNGWFRMGVNAGSSGTYNLSGTGTMNIAGRYYIGEGATTTGTAVQTGGTVNFSNGVNAGFWLATSDGATGTYTMSDGLLRQGNVADVANGDSWSRIGNGAGATATFNLTGGTVSLDARTLMAASGGSTSTVQQSGGVFEVRRGEMTIGDQGNATYNITAGTLRTLSSDPGADIGGHITVGQWDNSNGRLNVSGTALVEAGVNLQIADGRVEFPNAGTVTQTGGTVRVGTTGNGNLDMARTTSGTATYNLQGGVLDLTGGNINKGAGTATFAMTGGELRNVGSMNFPLVQTGGTLQVGDAGAVGTTTLNAYTQEALGTLSIDLGPGTSSDVLDINGNAILGGLLSLNVLDDSQIPVGTQFTILTPDALTGVFLNGATLVADTGQPFTINYAGGDGNDVVITAEVPEPAALGVIALALGGLLGVRRSRRPARL